jgi:hypothetical protein
MTPADFALLGITSETILTSMMFGFGFIVTCWYGGFIIAVANTVIKKI